MKIRFSLLALICVVQLTFAQFNYRNHTVVSGDDVYSIAKEYETTPEAIYELNPMAIDGIQPGTILLIPHVVKAPNKFVEGVVFKKHKTKSKETLYSIARKYNVELDNIKMYNDFLYDEPLRKGDILKIPFASKSVVKKIGSEKPKDTLKNKPLTKVYTLQPKDTKYGIARRFGITIPELEKLNPNLGEDFPIGYQLLLPYEEEFSESSINTDTQSEEFHYYEVLPKETLYSLSKRYGVSIDSLGVLNPNIKEGLKSGMILKLPNIKGASVMDLTKITNNFSVKKIALMLPFNANAVDFDDDEKVQEHISKSKVVRLTLDFYSGALMAVKEAKSHGISVDLEVLDTEKSEFKVASLIEENNLTTYDAVIGPLYKKNVEVASKKLTESGTPIFSPISSKVEAHYNNLYQTLPPNIALQEKMLSFVKKDTLDKKIVIIADEASKDIKNKLIAIYPKAKVIIPTKNSFVSEEDIIEVFGEEPSEDKHWVFLETKSLGLISNVIPFLNARAETHNITLFTSNKTGAYDSESIQNKHLTKLNFHYVSVIDESESGRKKLFEKKYFLNYKAKPSKYAIRGYDLTKDLILRLALVQEEKSIQDYPYLTEYIENKFYYKKNEKGGFENHSCYILKYTEGLFIKLVE